MLTFAVIVNAEVSSMSCSIPLMIEIEYSSQGAVWSTSRCICMPCCMKGKFFISGS